MNERNSCAVNKLLYLCFSKIFLFSYVRLSSDINEHFRYFLENICVEKLRKNCIFLNEHYFLPDYRTQRGYVAFLFLMKLLLFFRFFRFFFHFFFDFLSRKQTFFREKLIYKHLKMKIEEWSHSSLQ